MRSTAWLTTHSVHQVALLIARGADAAAASSRGLSALHVAASLGHAHLFAPLVAAGADINQPDTAVYDDADGKRTPLMYAAHYGCVAGMSVLSELSNDALYVA